MLGHKTSIYWVPLLLGAAFLILGLLLPAYISDLPSWVRSGAIALALMMIILTGVLAYLHKSDEAPRGGRGGSARAHGDHNEAVGGRGGNAGQGFGGDGGNAVARGRRSVAKGGEGGKGG